MDSASKLQLAPSTLLRITYVQARLRNYLASKVPELGLAELHFQEILMTKNYLHFSAIK